MRAQAQSAADKIAQSMSWMTPSGYLIYVYSFFLLFFLINLVQVPLGTVLKKLQHPAYAYLETELAVYLLIYFLK